MVLYFPVAILYIWFQIAKVKNIIYIYIVRFVLGYLLVSMFGVILYYLFSDLTLQSSTAIRTDIVYIFTACATLSAPILFLITVNLWKEQYRTSLNKETIIACIEEVEELKSMLLKSYEFLLGISKNIARNKEIIAISIKNNEKEEKIIQMIAEYQSGLSQVITELYEKRTYEIFTQKNIVFKKFRVLNISLNDMFDLERERIEQISIDFCNAIHDIYEHYLSKSNLKEESLDKLMDLLEDLAIITDTDLYVKFQNLLLLKENPL